MKKIVTFIILFGVFSFATAQDIQSKKGENYLPEAGDWAISFNANGVFKYLGNAFNGKLDNEAPSLSSPQGNAFVGKKFITDKSAYRVVVELGYISGNQISPDLNNNEINESKLSSFNLALGIGKEWRRGKTRLQGFYGADALISMSADSQEISVKNATTGVFIGSLNSEIAPTYGVAVQGFIGGEYFIFPKFSLGAQYTYRVGFNNGGNQTYTTKEGNNEPQTFDFGKTSNYNIGSMGVPFINLTLHF